MRSFFAYRFLWILLCMLLALSAACSQPIPISGSPAVTAQAGENPASTPIFTPTLPRTLTVTTTSVPPTGTSSPQPSATVEPSATFVAVQPLRSAALLQALRRGGYVIYFRHAATDQSQADTDTHNLENCQTQRNLTDQGRDDARRIGEAFRDLEIPVGVVLSSGYCRTLETAHLAFGRAEVSVDLTGFPAGLQESRVAALRQLLSTPPSPGTNTILVSHGFNIANTANLTISEGEAAIFAPRGAGGFALIARLKPGDWAGLGSKP